MKLKRILSLLLVVLMLVPCFCFSSCSFALYSVDLAISNYEDVTGMKMTQVSPPLGVQSRYIAADGGVMVFEDVKSAKLYESVLKAEHEHRTIQYEMGNKIAKLDRKQAISADLWSYADHKVTENRYLINREKKWEIERKGNMIYYGYPSFFNAIRGEAAVDSSADVTHSIDLAIDEVQYRLMSFYFDYVPTHIQESKGMKEYDSFVSASYPVFESLDITVETNWCDSEDQAKIWKKYMDDSRKINIEYLSSMVKYNEYILDEYGYSMDSEEYDRVYGETVRMDHDAEEKKRLVIARSGCLIFNGEFFDVAVACVVNFPVIRWMLNQI